MKWLKKNGVNLLLIIIFLVGVGLLVYPTAADYWNKFHQSRAIASYADAVNDMTDDTYERMLEEAHAYNEKLLTECSGWNLSLPELREYESILDITGTGIMGYIEIEKINCFLPIYHGTDEGVLQIAIGHIPGSSLPVGGDSTHMILSGHRGLPSARLFTDLDQMELGDTFVIRVLDEILTYEVDQITIVEPTQVEGLGIEDGKDLCTLVTCTPYGVNSHRMLVRGHRVENGIQAINVRVTPNATQIEPVLVAVSMEVPLLILLVLIVLIRTSKRRRKK